MGNYFLKILFAILMLLLHAEISILGFKWPTESAEVKCNEKEKQSLLNFKQGLRDPFGMLSTWRDDENNTDCCNWRGIECHNETGHVKMLHLRGGRPTREYLTGEINITSLIELQNMEYLDLSSNDFSGSQIPEHMGFLSNLRYLNLSYTDFGGRIPSELGNLSKLEYLSLEQNFLAGAIPSQLGKLTRLRYLDLSYNYIIDGEIPSQLGKLTRLRYLILSANDIDGEIPCQLGNLSQLQYLDLGRTYLSGAIPFHSGNLPMLNTLKLDGNGGLTINDAEAEWLSALSFLTNLDLSSFPNLGSSHHRLQTISKLIPNLRELRLVNCGLSDNDIPSLFHSHSNFSIMNFSSSLVSLDLSYNLLKSSAIFHWLSNFTTNLHSLNLYGNMLEGPIPDGFGDVMNSVEVLRLSYNKLQGKIPAFFGSICTLQELYLDNNNLRGQISNFTQNSSSCNIFKFQILDLSYNQITGMLPDLSIFSSLRMLDLSNNQLIGKIPESIGVLYKLESLHLEVNYLEGDINESHFTNLFKLGGLDLTDNSLSVKFGTGWVPPFQLYKLGLASCKLGPGFPSWLQTQSHLIFLDISHAGINDSVPDWFWSKLQTIIELNMSNNNLIGKIPNLPLKLDEALIFLNSNQFEGGIPAFLSQVSILDLSNNKISDLNTFLCGKSATTTMSILDLSSNQIMGQLPDCWEHLNALRFLDLSNNNLSGKIPQSMGALLNLEALVLRNNYLIGELPSTLKTCTNLVILDVGENLLSGTIPSWIGENLQELKILSLRVNHFFGSLPSYLCYLRQIHLLDLSRNNLSKGIPTCLKNFTTMMEKITISSEIVRERKVTSKWTSLDTYEPNVLLMWKGTEHEYWNPEIFLKSIDLSSNNLIGEIPKEIGYLLGLVSLNLSRNNLSGEIPTEIGNLYFLEFLDLSRNHFSGKIPSTLSKIDRLSVLDLSYNSLTGRIPVGTQLQTFDASQFEGNLDLCGEPLSRSCPEDKTTLKPQRPAVHDEDDDSLFYEALYMSLGIGFFTGFWGLIGPILLWRPWRIAYLRFLNRVTDYIYVMAVLNGAKCHMWLKKLAD